MQKERKVDSRVFFVRPDNPNLKLIRLLEGFLLDDEIGESEKKKLRQMAKKLATCGDQVRPESDTIKKCKMDICQHSHCNKSIYGSRFHNLKFTHERFLEQHPDGCLLFLTHSAPHNRDLAFKLNEIEDYKNSVNIPAQLWRETDFKKLFSDLKVIGSYRATEFTFKKPRKLKNIPVQGYIHCHNHILLFLKEPPLITDRMTLSKLFYSPLEKKMRLLAKRKGNVWLKDQHEDQVNYRIKTNKELAQKKEKARYDKTDFYLFPPTSFEDGFYRAGVDCTVANDENCEKVLWYTVKGENGYKDGMIREMTYSKSKKSGNYSLENLIQASIKGERWARQALIIYLLSTYKKRLFSYSKGLYCYRMTKEERLLEIKQYERLKMLKEMHMKPERKAKHKTLATQQKTKNYL